MGDQTISSTMTGCLTTQALGFGTGVVMSVLLFALLWRGAREQTGLRAKYKQVTFALMWNLGGLTGVLLEVVNGSDTSLWRASAGLLSFIGAAFFPLGYLALWQRPRAESSWQAKAYRWLCRLTLVSASLLTLVFLLRISGWSEPMHLGSMGMHNKLGRALALHVAIVTLAGTLLLLRGRLNNFAARFYAATTLIGVLVPAAITILAHGTEPTPKHMDWLEVVEQQAPLLILFGSVVYFGDFRFSNVYVKSCLRFLTALLLGAGVSLWLLFRLPPMAERLMNATTAGAITMATTMLTLLLCGFAWLSPKLNRLVDQWLFREPDYTAVMSQLWKKISQQEEEETIFATAAQLARETLGLQSTRVIALDSEPVGHLAAALNTGEVLELQPNDPLLTQDCLCGGAAFLAPIRVGGQPVYALAIVPGAQRRNLLDSELRFLRALAGQVSSRLESLAAQRARIEQQSKEERLRRQVTEAELRALRTQINPHFLFNSLNTIADLIVANPQQAELITVQLAKIFRHVLRGSECSMISVREELDFLKTWLNIEAVRFGDRLRVRFAVDDALAMANVPSLILQPLVENALKYGLAPKIGGGTLLIDVRRTGEQLSLMVEDDGLGFTKDPATLITTNEAARNGQGIGLRNVAERLATIYGGQAKMKCETVDTGGSRVTLLLPL
jgi:two-component system LytT family sensor kinase